MSPLFHLALIWLSVYVAVFLAAKTRLTPVLFFLFAGFVMINTGIWPEETSEFIEIFGEVGIIFIMFALGFEENPNRFMKGIKRSWGIALFGAIAPFTVAYFIADMIWHDSAISLLCGLTMTATAVSLTMVSLKSEGLQSSRAAMGIMTSAVLDDIASLTLIAVLVPIAVGDADFSLFGMFLLFSKAMLFFLIITILGVFIFPLKVPKWAKSIPLLDKIGIIHLLSFDKGKHATLTILLLGLSTGLLALKFGFHPAIGAYMAGLILRREYFNFKHDPQKNHYEFSRNIIDNAAFSWIGPIFFVNLGAQLHFDWDIISSILPYCLTLFLAIFIAQIASAGLAARYTAGMNWQESLMVGFGMLGRAELAFVVMDIAYIQHNIFTIEVFYTLMITAFFLNLAVPISISLWKPHFIRAGEKS